MKPPADGLSGADKGDGEVVKGLKERMVGVGLLIAAACLFSVASLCVKFATQRGVQPLHVLTGRLVLEGALAVLVCGIQRSNPLGKRSARKSLFMPGLLGSISLAFFYTALSLMPLAEANAIFFTSPIFATIVAHFWLGESLPIRTLSFGVLSFLGVVLISRPYGDASTTAGDGGVSTPMTDGSIGSLTWADHFRENPNLGRAVGSLLSLVGAVAHGSCMVAIRGVGDQASVAQTVFYFGGVGSAIFLPLGFALHHSSTDLYPWTDPVTLSFIIATGLAAFVAQAALNCGLRREAIRVGAFMRNFDVVCAFIFQVTLLKEPVKGTSVLGAALVVGASCLIVLFKGKENNAVNALQQCDVEEASESDSLVPGKETLHVR